MNYILFIIIGIIAGWLGSIIVKGKGQGLLVNMIVGIIGAFIGGSILDHLHIHMPGFFGLLVASTLGAVLLIWLIGLIRR
ncbi:GlsB/YeaQ/YmgE family stress response membrane protein [Marinifilum fragile]|jgi:Transglycosylase associated protein.|uniref:GlsB/YeaQ/YmgE family stress response membrane protein n=1 Tax=Marinifilum fragile TaxID=570161 RepID=UPI0006D212E2|nr:GlsB/YeaQ/YmgE family stress response membrane protein [Marinifilum fragile]